MTVPDAACGVAVVDTVCDRASGDVAVFAEEPDAVRVVACVAVEQEAHAESAKGRVRFVHFDQVPNGEVTKRRVISHGRSQ